MHFSFITVLVLVCSSFVTSSTDPEDYIRPTKETILLRDLKCEPVGENDLHSIIHVIEQQIHRYLFSIRTSEDYCVYPRTCYCFSTSIFLNWKEIDYSIAIGYARKSAQHFPVEEILRKLSTLNPEERESYLAPLISDALK